MAAFTAITQHRPGIIAELLSESYAPLLAADARHWGAEESKWRAFDREAFANTQTIGACLFFTTIEARPIGFASWDPRQWPEVAVIGHNCILPAFQRRGCGRRQVQEVLRRLRARGFRRAAVRTSEHPFFEPAQRMYLSCDFRETTRALGGPDPRYGTIHYEALLASDRLAPREG